MSVLTIALVISFVVVVVCMLVKLYLNQRLGNIDGMNGTCVRDCNNSTGTVIGLLGSAKHHS